MKITSVESFIVDAGWRPWVFVKVETDEGIVGYVPSKNTEWYYRQKQTAIPNEDV